MSSEWGRVFFMYFDSLNINLIAEIRQNFCEIQYFQYMSNQLKRLVKNIPYALQLKNSEKI